MIDGRDAVRQATLAAAIFGWVSGSGRMSTAQAEVVRVHTAVEARKRLNRRLFVTTDTLDSDIAALAMTGDNRQPVSG